VNDAMLASSVRAERRALSLAFLTCAPGGGVESYTLWEADPAFLCARECMYVCMYVCMYLRMNVYTCVYMCVCVCLLCMGVHVCMYIRIYLCMYVSTYVRV